MTGETDLNKLLASMEPVLGPETYVFCTLQNARYGYMAELKPLASFQETEGLTLVIKQKQADKHKLNYQGTFALISLKVHSSLEAVGLTAAVSGCLAKANISANVIAAYYHDHILIPSAQAQQALQLLQQMAHQHQ